MARIVYAIASEGFGHSARSKAVLDYITKKHDVLIITGGQTFSYLKDYYDNIYENCGLRIKYKKGKVSNLGTLYLNIKNLILNWKKNTKVGQTIKQFNPDYIISDFEFYTNYFSLLKKTPIISIDNQHIITNTKIDYDLKNILSFIKSYLVVKLISPNKKTALITTFFYPKITKKNTVLVPPILRDEILKLKPEKKEYIFVYQTSDSDKEKLASILRNVDENFVVYNVTGLKNEKNITYKNFNSNEFFQDLKCSKAVIMNGGLTLMYESLHLKKPVLSVPIRKQFEQELNAHYLEKLGYGKLVTELSVKSLTEFIENLKYYEDNLKKYKGKDNREVFYVLDKLLI